MFTEKLRRHWVSNCVTVILVLKLLFWVHLVSTCSSKHCARDCWVIDWTSGELGLVGANNSRRRVSCCQELMILDWRWVHPGFYARLQALFSWGDISAWGKGESLVWRLLNVKETVGSSLFNLPDRCSRCGSIQTETCSLFALCEAVTFWLGIVSQIAVHRKAQIGLLCWRNCGNLDGRNQSMQALISFLEAPNLGSLLFSNGPALPVIKVFLKRHFSFEWRVIVYNSSIERSCWQSFWAAWSNCADLFTLSSHETSLKASVAGKEKAWRGPLSEALLDNQMGLFDALSAFTRAMSRKHEDCPERSEKTRNLYCESTLCRDKHVRTNLVFVFQAINP